jgi:predicted nuclease of predicted toxin-antitoxin system
MSLRELKFLADENINYIVVAYLREQGLDVEDIKELGLSGIDDQSVLAYAVKNERVVITQDSDFGTLSIVEQQPFLGIIYLKPGHIIARFTIESLGVLLSTFNQEIIFPFILVVKRQDEKVKIRFRQY